MHGMRLWKVLNRVLVMLDTASLVYKINNDLTPQHTKDWFTKFSTVHSYSTRAAVAENFGIPKVKTEKAKQSFPTFRCNDMERTTRSCQKVSVN